MGGKDHDGDGDRYRIDDVAFIGRTFEEYRRVLDCPAGAYSFVAQARERAARRFVTDYARHPGRYVAGALPRLPFPDDAVSLVLSAHFLFLYDDRLDDLLAALRADGHRARGQPGHSHDPRASTRLSITAW